MVTEGPLSYSQQLLTAFAAGDGASVFGSDSINWGAYELTGPVNPTLLRQALADVVTRQEALRTVVVRSEGCPFQRVLPPFPAPLRVHDLDADTAADRLVGTARVAAAALAEGLPSDTPPLLAAHLVRFPGERSALILLIHRTVDDGWTMQVAVRDVMTGYERRLRGLEPTPPPLVRYVEHALAASARGHEELIQDAMGYWVNLLGDVSTFGIPTDRPRGPGSGGPKAVHTFELDDGTVDALKTTARRMRVTFPALPQAAYAIALSTRTPGNELVVPVLSSGRSRNEWDTIGFFTNGHLLRIRLDDEPSLADLARRVDDALIGTVVNDVPLVRVLEAVPAVAEAFDATDLVPAPIQLCQEIPTSDDPDATVRYRRLKLPPDVVQAEPVMPVDFLWVVEPYITFAVQVTYNPRLFDEETVRALGEAFRHGVRQLITDPHRPLAELRHDLVGAR